MMLNTTEKFICKYIAAQCIVIYAYYICSQTVNYLVTTTIQPSLFSNLRPKNFCCSINSITFYQAIDSNNEIVAT